MLSEITPLILTFNERDNLSRTLAPLHWASQVVIIDSFSTDETCHIARANPRVMFLQRHFDSFADQCNFGLKQIKTHWVLSLDADYILTPELVKEISSLNPSVDVGGYQVRFRYCLLGRPLR